QLSVSGLPLLPCCFAYEHRTLQTVLELSERRLGAETKEARISKTILRCQMSKTHKLIGSTTMTHCPVWLGTPVSHEYYASRWWKYVDCKLCLRKRRMPSKFKETVK